MLWQLVYEKENSEFKPVKLHLKFDLGSHPACLARLGKHTHTHAHTHTHMYIYVCNKWFNWNAVFMYIKIFFSVWIITIYPNFKLYPNISYNIVSKSVWFTRVSFFVIHPYITYSISEFSFVIYSFILFYLFIFLKNMQIGTITSRVQNKYFFGNFFSFFVFDFNLISFLHYWVFFFFDSPALLFFISFFSAFVFFIKIFFLSFYTCPCRCFHFLHLSFPNTC